MSDACGSRGCRLLVTGAGGGHPASLLGCRVTRSPLTERVVLFIQAHIHYLLVGLISGTFTLKICVLPLVFLWTGLLAARLSQEAVSSLHGAGAALSEGSNSQR